MIISTTKNWVFRQPEEKGEGIKRKKESVAHIQYFHKIKYQTEITNNNSPKVR